METSNIDARSSFLIISGVFFLFVFLATPRNCKLNKVLLKLFLRFTKRCKTNFYFQDIADFVYLLYSIWSWRFHLESLTFQKFIALILNILSFKLSIWISELFTASFVTLHLAQKVKLSIFESSKCVCSKNVWGNLKKNLHISSRFMLSLYSSKLLLQTENLKN